MAVKVIFLVMLIIVGMDFGWSTQVWSTQRLTEEVIKLQSQITQLTAKTNRHVAFHAEFRNDPVALHPDATYVLDNVITNIGNGYDHYSGHFRAPVPGTYMFVVDFMGPMDMYQYAFIKVDDQISAQSISHSNGAWDKASAVLVTHLKQGQNVWVTRNSEQQVTKTIRGSHWTTFSGFLIHAD